MAVANFLGYTENGPLKNNLSYILSLALIYAHISRLLAGVKNEPGHGALVGKYGVFNDFGGPVNDEGRRNKTVPMTQIINLLYFGLVQTTQETSAMSRRQKKSSRTSKPRSPMKNTLTTFLRRKKKHPPPPSLFQTKRTRGSFLTSPLGITKEPIRMTSPKRRTKKTN